MTLYLDTSSLVKLYVAESGSDDIQALVGRARVVATSIVAYPETRAAMARRRRERALRPAAFAAAKQAFQNDWPSYLVVRATSAVCTAAGDLAERYALRGYDSIHLASFLAIAREAGVGDAEFSSFDDRLNRAARRAVRGIVSRARR